MEKTVRFGTLGIPRYYLSLTKTVRLGTTGVLGYPSEYGLVPGYPEVVRGLFRVFFTGHILWEYPGTYPSMN